MLMGGEIDELALKLDAFHFKKQALFRRGARAGFDFAAGADHSLPGKGVKRIGAKEAGDGSVIKRIAGGGGDLSIGRDAAFRNGSNDSAE
jgi:hypothetical protein